MPDPQGTLTLLDVLKRSTSWLEGRGVDSPRLDAELLVAHALGLSRLQLYLQFDRPLKPEERDAIRSLVRRRGDHVPVAYLVGTREFYSLSFRVGPGVLVPRPETEHLVEAALSRLAGIDEPVFADVGTGSGCIAIALLRELPRARAHATDVSAVAIRTTRENAEAHGVLDRLALHEGDLLAPLRALPDWGRLDLVVSNPPYVVESDASVEPGVRAHEPPEALFVPGADPLEVAARVAREAREALRAGGWLLLEVGAGSAPRAEALLQRLGYGEREIAKDLAGIGRVVAGRKT